MNRPEFAHLHNYSVHSLYQSLCSCSSALDRALDRRSNRLSEQLFGHLSVRADNLKISAIALTDLNVLSGAPDFYSSWPKTLHKMKPIIGLTACLQSPGMVNPCGPLGPIGVVLLAKNAAGYRNLVMISSALGCKGTATTDGLVCLTLEEFERIYPLLGEIALQMRVMP